MCTSIMASVFQFICQAMCCCFCVAVTRHVMWIRISTLCRLGMLRCISYRLRFRHEDRPSPWLQSLAQSLLLEAPRYPLPCHLIEAKVLVRNCQEQHRSLSKPDTDTI